MITFLQGFVLFASVKPHNVNTLSDVLETIIDFLDLVRYFGIARVVPLFHIIMLCFKSFGQPLNNSASFFQTIHINTTSIISSSHLL
ncbi:hypothetical protein HanIR_Chr02g0063751 [Helianthus annuus]|nr:hypothetical protein HanIR_Chr02g0063751 [Helianthus annuus]